MSRKSRRGGCAGKKGHGAAETSAQAQTAGIGVVKAEAFAGGQTQGFAVLMRPEILAVKIEVGLFGDVPDIAESGVQAVVGGTAVIGGLASEGVAQIGVVVVVVQAARATAASA